MLESIYRAASLRTGLFTSPHLVSFRERIQVNRQLISEEDVVRLVVELREHTNFCADSGGAGRRDACPTFFEFVTVMALKYFAEQECNLVIWETGLGGRLDATNIVMPLASVITNIAFEHEQWLGDTLAKIAAEKAGIIKPGVPVLTATDEPEALAVIEQTAREKNAPLVNVAQASRLHAAAETAALPLLGEHQRTNAALGLATVEILQKQIPVPEAKIRAGLAKVDWPGRLQVVTRPSGGKLLLDGAHNVAGAKVLREALEKNFSAEKCTLIFGVLQDKDWRHICEMLTPLAARIFTVPVASERSANAHELAAAYRAANPNAEVIACDSLSDALTETTADEFSLVTGSLYLVGEALELLGLSPANGGERALNEWSAAPSQPLH
jgi:dihydrofolate synthase/folylpolyglutamate synthase